MEALAPHGVVPHHVEGLTQGPMGAVGLRDFVVHVFHRNCGSSTSSSACGAMLPVLAAGAPDSGSKG